ncbi:MAG: hypothetical protein ACI9CD_001008 [Candidatus Deianiraeaceae bacterium]|jgi:hypothetical protein
MVTVDNNDIKATVMDVVVTNSSLLLDYINANQELYNIQDIFKNNRLYADGISEYLQDMYKALESDEKNKYYAQHLNSLEEINQAIKLLDKKKDDSDQARREAKQKEVVAKQTARMQDRVAKEGGNNAQNVLLATEKINKAQSSSKTSNIKGFSEHVKRISTAKEKMKGRHPATNPSYNPKSR